MELKELITMQLDSQKQGTMRVLDSLTQPEIAWRPASGSNSIGIILFHMSKFEDTTIQARMQGKPEVWESEKWYEKLGLPVGEVGAHYTVDQVNSFPVPELSKLAGYANVVRAKTLQYLGSLTPGDFDKRINMPRTAFLEYKNVISKTRTHHLSWFDLNLVLNLRLYNKDRVL